MPIISFWSSGSEHAGKTLSIAAIATYMAIEHNYRILVISTDYNKKDIENCFWKEQKRKISFGLFGPNTSVGLDDGVEGLMKIMKSNKLSPELIKDYTKIVFKDRLEVLPSFKGSYSEYAEIKRKYSDVVNLANGYYDLVLVDLSEHLEDDTIQNILNDSNLIIANISQRLSSIDTFIENREKSKILNTPKTLILVNRFDKYSKYTAKNISRYMKEKNLVSTIPYNTLFFEACEEAQVPDLFLKLRRIKDTTDRNAFFMQEIKRTVENITYRLQDLRKEG